MSSLIVTHLRNIVSNTTVKPKESAILKAIGRLAKTGQEPSRQHVQLFSGNNKTVEGFKKNLSSLRKKKLIEYGAGTLKLTEDGSNYLENHCGMDISTPVGNKEAQDICKSLLKPKACSIFGELLDGKAHERVVVAKSLHYDMDKLSGFKKDISSMKSLGLLEYVDGTKIQLTDLSFPAGRRSIIKQKIINV